jgi:probable HAF family extracellular repeat protein
MIGLGYLAGQTSNTASAVSADGSVVVGYSPFGGEAFRWTQAGGMMGLGLLPGSSGLGSGTFAKAVSADGSVVVGSGSTSSPGGEAFIWDPAHGIRLLSQVLTEDGIDLTGWTLQVATGVSGDGDTIVGFGHDRAVTSRGGSRPSPSPAPACS